MEPEKGPQSFRLIACPHLLAPSKDRLDVVRPVGGTVTDLLRSIGWTPDRLSARVFLDGELVRDAAWEYTTPRAGQSLVVLAVPLGGDNGKSALRIAAMIGVIGAAIFAPYSLPATWELTTAAGGLTLVGVAASAGISLVGSLALSGLVPRSLPRRPLLEDRSRKAVAR